MNDEPEKYFFDTLPESEKEALCRQCGKCCYEKLIIAGQVFFTSQSCRFLDTKSQQCTVYGSRHAEQWNCGNLKSIIKFRGLPEDCPYILGLADYTAPIEGMIDLELQAGLEQGEDWAFATLETKLRESKKYEKIADLLAEDN